MTNPFNNALVVASYVRIARDANANLVWLKLRGASASSLRVWRSLRETSILLARINKRTMYTNY